MSTTLRFVKPEHASILREYLADGAVALFFDEEIEQAKSLGYNDEDQLEDYDFGGDPDSLIEKVSSPHHHIFECMPSINE
ncbi:hypothetical protein L1267_22225 [Pseudoalteromonas sp. OFAV1]|jgi:hypothetical protein|uniref:hypothetical protein n=1 Tax=Pseudoalteromonas sp. OFAV1 TaxID=2908892 RepID=UPI001F36F3DC|nr:hypothetical protein [Pseudoalteromonas sp. OFAV1]MCF2903090.1 hypothetical protein [Pseudoalteromonas sp. OFAV1]